MGIKVILSVVALLPEFDHIMHDQIGQQLYYLCPTKSSLYSILKQLLMNFGK